MTIIRSGRSQFLRVTDNEMRLSKYNLPTAKKIFGDKFDAFQKVNSDDKKRNEVRRAAVAEYVKTHRLPVKMYKDYGWDPVKF